ncbi:hypothetical protein SRB5_13340 [Streptomyces sp. RB5]|uniref:SH3 domain-containing protein n=1 Tax=Streptomyces smaragdinus TaxID=2585196 RepID=A0A7K0CCP0_9ACTN|nr:hypothetical protein [Streptomyces smaragdinus]MQY11219.1 hypothetical protein [Streptomyces smaragdinus]
MYISMRRSAVSLVTAGALAGGLVAATAPGATAASAARPAAVAAGAPCSDSGCGTEWNWDWDWNWNTASQPPPGPAPAPAPQQHNVGWGRVTAHTQVNIRRDPTSDSPKAGVLRPGEEGPVFCVTEGQSVNGNQWWYWVDTGWASAAFIRVTGDVDTC